MIGSPGVGSGLDVQSIVSQLMALERRPLQVLQQSKSTLDAQLSAYGRFRSSLSSFQTALTDLKSLDAFKVYSATSSNSDALTATADADAAIGTLDVQINRLAQAHKQGSLAIADTGTTTLGGAGDQMTITIDGTDTVLDVGGMTLAQIRTAINEADAGVTAMIVSENDTSHRLVLTSTETGSAQAMTLSFSGTLGADLGMATINDIGSLAELDAEIVVDSMYTITRGSNTIDDAIDGLTLTLKAETTSAATLTLARDTEAVAASAQKFVDAYNELRSTITALRGKELKSDSTLRSIEAQIQTIFNTPPDGVDGSYSHLSQIGVSIQKDGTMKLDATALDQAIAADFDSVAQLFANDDQGYMYRLDAAVTGLLQSDGLLDGREDGIKASQKTVESRIDNMEYRLQLIEQRYRAQFTALDAMLGQMQGTSQFLLQQLG
jgi:flagellar hook-associated protein 2